MLHRITLKNKSYSIEQRLVTPSVVSNSKCTTTYSLKEKPTMSLAPAQNVHTKTLPSLKVLVHTKPSSHKKAVLTRTLLK